MSAKRGSRSAKLDIKLPSRAAVLRTAIDLMESVDFHEGRLTVNADTRGGWNTSVLNERWRSRVGLEDAERDKLVEELKRRLQKLYGDKPIKGGSSGQ